MENLYVTFEVRVSNDPYRYDPDGRGELSIQLPRNILDQVKLGTIFDSVLEIALANHDAKNKEEEE